MSVIMINFFPLKIIYIFFLNIQYFLNYFSINAEFHVNFMLCLENPFFFKARLVPSGGSKIRKKHLQFHVFFFKC